MLMEYICICPQNQLQFPPQKNYLYKYIRSDVGHSLWHALIVWKKNKTKHHIFILRLPPSGSLSTLGSATLWESLPHSFRKTEKEHTP